MPRIATPLLFALAIAMPAAALAAYPGHPTTSPDITAADISARDKAISDDAFEGRGPGTPSGEAAAQWIADELKRHGRQARQSWQLFPDRAGRLHHARCAGIAFRLRHAQGHADAAISPMTSSIGRRNSPAPMSRSRNPDLVFVGYGVVAPEYHWNDYAGIDVKGKTVVILVNDPGNEDANPDPNFFKGKAMTYYGRWTYKYEEAARQGAAAAIIVHETKPAAYGWQVVRTSNWRDKLWLDAADKNISVRADPRLDHARHRQRPVQPRRSRLRQAEGRRQQARLQGGADDGRKSRRDAHSAISHLKTRNVVGVIPGSSHPDDVVMFSAHWDHLGRKDNLPGTDKIYNGAVDNGMGISMVLELAEKFAHDPPPQRSLVFAFWTLEEQGLLGSEYFAEHPLWPRNHIVGVINLDGDGPRPRSHDVEASGTGQSEMEDVLKKALADAGPHAFARPGTGKRRVLPLRPFQPGQAWHSRNQPRRRTRSSGRRQGGGPETGR